MRATVFFYRTSYKLCYMEWPYILMHRAYPLSLEKPSSLNLSCGLGFGFMRMVRVYLVDLLGPFQGISLDFMYLVWGRKR